MMPTLLAVAHGTRHVGGPRVIRELLDRVRVLRPGLHVAEAYAEIAVPSLEAAAVGLGGPVVVVPMMLARGYHALVDIPGRVQELFPAATTSRPLGPHPLLGRALVDRLGPVLDSADSVVLGAAGSSDPAGVADVRMAARQLSVRLRRPVRYGFVAAGEPDLAEVVRSLPGRVAVASYLLAPGYFHDRIAASGADYVSPPIGAHDAVARLILRRFDEAYLRSRRMSLAAG